MRQVQVFKWEQQTIDGCRKSVKVPDGMAAFHQFGNQYEEFDNGAGNYTTAIIERADGSVQQVNADMVKFIDPPVLAGPAENIDLRDYFAAKAMQALIAKHGGHVDDHTAESAIPSFSEEAPNILEVVEYAYGAADAMLVERAK
ncbi:hypothetical protein [Janthinobacterium sp. UMAB-56]|uniref:hypothetical protein n=1 Tax=Janthinobacterium sp. UMAB-56 TaxID=1365361 RepID=UPI001C58BEBB|nr:hypothetical protein [Janthinobacterium sp. UMAB-56]